jgi:hypothetical protein
VLTGGPCGGKSTILEIIKLRFEGEGYKVFSVPEIPTMMIAGGCEYPGHDGGEKLMAFETALIKLQIQAEESFMAVARSTGQKSIVVFDRGLLDIPAYLPEEQWAQVLRANRHLLGPIDETNGGGGLLGTTEGTFLVHQSSQCEPSAIRKQQKQTHETDQGEAALAARYDMVLHLVTAADGAEKFYTSANNAARTETASEARALDLKVRNSWSRQHKNVAVIDNSTPFAEKCDRAISALTKFLEA